MKEIAIYGAGGFGREIFNLIVIINKLKPTWKIIGFFDDGKEIGSTNEYGTILGGLKELNAWKTELSIVFAIGSPKVLQKLTSKVINPLIKFPNLISPDTISYGPIEEKLGKGNVICSRGILSCNVKLGDFNILNGYVAVGHDTHIGNFNVAMPGTKLSGELKVGNCNLFGANSFVLQGTTIGDNITLTPCSALLRRPKDGNIYIGNPAVIMKY